MLFYGSIVAPLLISFIVLALASQRIGNLFSHFNLPKITGFLVTGLIIGPFVLGLLPDEESVRQLRFIDEMSLAFIAFAAGSELYLPELQGHVKSIIWVMVGLVVVTFALGSAAVFLMRGFLPFMHALLTPGRLAAAFLAGAILVARSPSSAIAIINELRAKGPFTKVAISVTVIMDVVVIVLFAISSSVADALLTNVGLNIGFVFLLIAELLLAGVSGYGVSHLLMFVMKWRFNDWIKTAAILAIGFGVFLAADTVREITHTLLPFELFIEPLLVCVVASFTINNYSRYRSEFLHLVYGVGPYVYVAFFTLTGASLELDVLLATWPIALALFGVRVVSIVIGSFFGGVLAGDPMQHNRLKWMAFITQAGVAIGLAKEVAVEFPQLGTAFTTTIISVVVLNEMIGPLLLKYAINRVGEARTRADAGEFDGSRDALIFGLTPYAHALARQLQSHGWNTKIITRHPQRLGEREISDIPILPIPELSVQALKDINIERVDGVVSLLVDDEGYKLCELIYENFGIENVVAQVRDRTNVEPFHELGVLTVNYETAVVHLLDQFVRSPSSTSMLLGMEDGQDIVEFEVRDPELHGVALRDMDLPIDVLLLSAKRGRQRLIMHGYTRLELGDRITMVGSREKLEEVRLKFDAPYQRRARQEAG